MRTSNVDSRIGRSGAALDAQTREEMQILMLDSRHKPSDTIMFVTHDVQEAVRWPTVSCSWTRIPAADRARLCRK